MIAAIIGVAVSDITSEISTAAESVMANSRNSRPTMPPMNSSGMNTATRLIEIDTTVKPTSLAPFSAASTGFMPSSTWRLMFSSTTIASSTTKPVATVSAISDRLFSEKPSSHMMPRVPASDATTATAGTIVARHEPRKMLTTATTSSVAMTRVSSTSCSEARMVMVRSVATSRFTSAGRAARSTGNCALIASTVAMMLAAGCRLMMATIDGWPLNSPVVRVSSTESLTLATSCKRTGAPLR